MMHATIHGAIKKNHRIACQTIGESLPACAAKIFLDSQSPNIAAPRRSRSLRYRDAGRVASASDGKALIRQSCDQPVHGWRVLT